MSLKELTTSPKNNSENLEAKGYQQIYIIKRCSNDKKNETTASTTTTKEVFFRCGNWSYSGEVQFDFSGGKMTLSHIPYIIPILQKQQDNLSLIEEDSSTKHHRFQSGINILEQAHNFLISELTSESILQKIDNDDKRVYFELELKDELLEVVSQEQEIQCMCSKLYINELILVSIYFEGSFYLVVDDAKDKTLPILDVRFPDVTNVGEGYTLALYDESGSEIKDENIVDNFNQNANKQRTNLFKKLSIWKALPTKNDTNRPGTDTNSNKKKHRKEKIIIPKQPKVRDLSSPSYVHAFCVLKPSKKNSSNDIRSVFFRFGSWCYTGKVKLLKKLHLVDVPHVIPEIKAQQKDNLKYFCDASKIPDNQFLSCLAHADNVSQIMEREAYKSEESIFKLHSQLCKLGVEQSATNWLIGESESDDTNNDTFFEFSFTPSPMDKKAYEHIDLVAIKRLHPNGVTATSIYFDGTFYLTLESNTLCTNNNATSSDGIMKEQEMLDCNFPTINEKGRGYQLKTFPTGVDGWTSLRRMFIWQTLGGMEKDMDGKFIDRNDHHIKEGVDTNNELKVSESETMAISEEKKVIDQEDISGEEKKIIEPSLEQSNDEKVSSTKDQEISVTMTKERREKPKATAKSKVKKSRRNKDLQGKSNSGDRELNLGAFHHLAPLKVKSKKSRLQRS